MHHVRAKCRQVVIRRTENYHKRVYFKSVFHPGRMMAGLWEFDPASTVSR
ncbi:MAG: hypothetical protein H6Q57_1030 [Geobacteraceae bacterium]|jgi:hypothetical protein|nr:hypothetical protein [Geobacteraceae bacterium]